MTDKSRLNIHLLGDLRIERGGEILPPVTSARAQSLLAYLVLHAGVPQSRRHLAFLLWPDSSEEQSRSNLRKLLHDLRRSLPDVDRYVVSEGPNLMWRADAPFTLDVSELTRALNEATTAAELQQAVGLYRGPLFQSCYDDWVLPERERLQQHFVDSVGRLVELLEAQGEYRTAIQYAQMLLQHDPLHEDVYRSLMRLYALTDDRAAALRTYQTCTAILKRELDVEPSPATKQAHERLLNLQSATALPPPAPIPLVGHAREWSRLQEAWHMVARGQPHWAMLTGAAGIGKTRLAEELLRWAAKQGIPTATARCYAAESGLGYGPITTWLRARPLPALEKLWLGEIARLLPELLIQQPDLPPPGPLTESWQRLRFFEALARAVLASQPLILLIDDIQYCDRDTLEWLHYLLRFNPQASLLLVSTLCLEDLAPDHPLHQLLATFRRAGQLSEIGVQPLSSTETAELAAQVQGRSLEPALATKLFAETEGSPLFVLEMVRSGQLAQAGAPLPRTIQAVIGARLGQLSPETRQLVQVAAVIGRAFTIDILGRASGTGEEALARGLAELRQRRIVRAPQGEGYDFDHSQLRAVAYANLNPAERQMLHRRVAEALVALPDPAPNDHSGEIVEHFERAGLTERAVPYRIQAGDAARRMYANETAIRYYRHALPMLSPTLRGEIMLRLGKVLELVGNSTEAESNYRQALELAQAERDPQILARAQKALGEHLHRRGQERAALDLFEQARQGFAGLNDLRSVGKVMQHMGVIYDFLGDDPRALAYHQQHLAYAMRKGDRQGVGQAIGNIGLVNWRQANYPRALQFYRRQLEIAEEVSDRRGMNRALAHQGMALFEQGEYSAAETAYLRALEIAAETGDRLSMSYISGHLGRVYHVQGKHASAMQQFLKQLETTTELRAQRGIGYAFFNMGVLYQDRGDYDRSFACYGKSLEVGLDLGDRRMVAYNLMYLADALAQQGKTREAKRVGNQALILLRAMNMRYYLSDHLYRTARLNQQDKCFAEAGQFNAQALQMATLIGRQSIQFKGKVLRITLGVETRETKPATAVEQLQGMLDKWRGEEEQAALYYELAKLERQNTAWQNQAARLYRKLYAHSARGIYRKRYEELTNKRLPPAEAIPDLPETVDCNTEPIAVLLGRVDRYVNGKSQGI